MSEEFRAIPGWEGFYEVSDAGTVRSLDRVVRSGPNRFTRQKAKIIKPTVDRLGYCRVYLSRDGKDKGIRVHSLVLLAFVGPRQEGIDGCHNDGNPSNNRLKNLRYDTEKGNMADRVRHGTDCRGTKHPRAILSEYDVLYLRTLGPKWRTSTLARMYGLDFKTISKARRGQSWAHIC